MKRILLLSFSIPVLCVAVALFSGCVRKIIIDGATKRLIRTTAGDAAKSGVKLSEAEARNRALVVVAKLRRENPTLLEYFKEKGEEKVGDCVAREALHDALQDTQLSGIAESGCFPDISK
jgi:hypothetical protein